MFPVIVLYGRLSVVKVTLPPPDVFSPSMSYEVYILIEESNIMISSEFAVTYDD